MNFFSSFFSDDSDNAHRNESQDDSDVRSDASVGGAWEFGGLWKTLSANTESIIETYRRDLQEFGTGLRKEIEVAHGSLESVGHVIDHFGNTIAKGTAQFISHGKDAILIDSDSDSDNYKKAHGTEKKSFHSKGYSRFDFQLRAIQGDVSTYTEVPEDLDEYENWKSGFSLEGKREEMEGFWKENEAVETVYKRVVPGVVDRDTFWFRYYYRVYRFKKAEDVRARLVRRMSRDEEELSWDIEEEDDDDDQNKGKHVEEMHKSAEDGSKEGKRGEVFQSKEMESVEESKVDKNKEIVEKMGDENVKSINEEGKMNDYDKKVTVERKVDDSIDSLVANMNSRNEKEEEEDLEWDEIEDLSRIDEENAT